MLDDSDIYGMTGGRRHNNQKHHNLLAGVLPKKKKKNPEPSTATGWIKLTTMVFSPDSMFSLHVWAVSALPSTDICGSVGNTPQTASAGPMRCDAMRATHCWLGGRPALDMLRSSLPGESITRSSPCTGSTWIRFWPWSVLLCLWPDGEISLSYY